MNTTTNTAQQAGRSRDPRFLTILAIVQTVNEFPEGAPEGPVYLALMQHGISYDTYTRIVSGLNAAGIIRKQGSILYPTNLGKAFTHNREVK